MQLNPARGRKLDNASQTICYSRYRFMQLNPARGRKLKASDDQKSDMLYKVYAAQPREGTET